MTEGKSLRVDARRNRDALVAAARGAFDGGSVPARFDDFAALAGVGVGTLYRHFPTRESLATAVYEDEVIALCDRGRALLTECPAAEALTTFLRTFTEYVVAHAALAQALAALVGPDTDGKAEKHALEQTVADLLAAGLVDGSIHANATPGAVMVVLHGIGSSTARADWSSASIAAVDIFLRGLNAT